MAKQEQIHFRVDGELKKRAEQLAAFHHRSLANYIENLIQNDIRENYWKISEDQSFD